MQDKHPTLISHDPLRLKFQMSYLIQVLIATFILSLNSLAIAQESICYGTTGKGRLENGVKLPGKGKNFTSYGTIPELSGRTYVHSKVKETILDAYKILETDQPKKVYKYAETGYEEGGEFKPHKTHQNGLSVDFITPALNSEGESAHLPTHVLNKYGYSIEFDKEGRYRDYKIDFEALGAHIVALHKAAEKNGVGLWRVLFDPALQPYLFKTKYGKYIKQNVEIPNKRSWVRHDDHYHVDFDVKCKSI